MKTQTLAPDQVEGLISSLKSRFEKNLRRHDGITWTDVLARLEPNPEKLWSLSEMERTGGEPDVVGRDPDTGEFIFVDCAPESPAGRRNLCYDREALDSRKEFKPGSSAVEMATDMDIELLSVAEYRHLQTLGEFDLKTSSWINTPLEIRKLGGALFADRRYDHVFVYHNSAPSYYSSRGFRASLKV